MSTLQGVNSVDIAISILNFIAKSGGVARAADISKACEISKSRLHKYLVSLCRTQMLYQETQTSRYCLGSNLLLLASVITPEHSFIDAINKSLIEFRDEQNYSTGVVVNLGKELVLSLYNRSFKNVDIDFLPNTSVPTNLSAAGFIFAAFGDLDINSGIEESELEIIRQQGYATRHDPVDGIPGAQSISCPVFNRQGKLIAAAVTIGFIPEAEMLGLSTALIKKVKTIII